MTKKLEQQLKRLDIVNAIIAEIQERGRGFFKYRDVKAFMVLKEGKVYYMCEHKHMLLYIGGADSRKPEGWSHGGTCLALVKDFRDYIQTGEYTNGRNGYGGLYCPHWGYEQEDMVAIQEKAVELGYLKQRTVTT